MTPIVVNRFHILMGEDDLVYIGRGSLWGNPFSHKEGTKADFIVESREEAVAQYELLLWQRIQSGVVTLEQLASLQGKRLVCFCKPAACHGDVLAKASDWAVRQLQQGVEV